MITNTSETIKIATEHFMAGRLIEAEVICKMILELEPNNPESLHIMGMVAHNNGNHDVAINLINKAILSDPSNYKIHNNAGCIYKTLNNTEMAIACHEKAIEIKYDFVIAHINLGLLYHQQYKFDKAVYHYRQALSVDPCLVDVLNNLGSALKSMRKNDEALSCYQLATEVSPENVTALCRLGSMLRDQGLCNEAVAYFRKAVAIEPKNTIAHNNLGFTFQMMHRFSDAIDCFEKTLAIKPYLTDSCKNANYDQERFDEALVGVALIKCSQGLADKATTCLQQVIENNPHNYNAHSSLLMVMNYSEQCSQKDIFTESLKWESLHCGESLESEFGEDDNTLPTGLVDFRIRIGFVSSDFKYHSVSYFIEPLLKFIDITKFETFCYSDVAIPDLVTKRLKVLAGHWIETTTLDDIALINLIRSDRIDILVDLAGHTRGNRLRVFAGRAAPIQVSWLGYPNTTGLSAIDFRFTDDIADPSFVDDCLHSERLIRLKNGFLCYQPIENAPEIGLPACLSKGFITFGSFNNIAKMSPDVFAVWARILRRVKNSRLLLKCQNLADHSTAECFKRNFTDFGITSDRIEIRSIVADQIGHLSVYREIDIALDPFPYNGTTTTFEALWMGVPVITLSGERHSARVGASIMTRLGLPELVASSSNEYITIAEKLAGEQEQLKKLHKTLRKTLADSVWCDAESFSKEVGSAFEHMVSENRQSEKVLV